MSEGKIVKTSEEGGGVRRGENEGTEVVRKPVKKHSRRAALKFLAKVGLGAALWGTGGYFAGKIFGAAVKPVVDSVLGTSERITSAYQGLKRLNPFYKA